MANATAQQTVTITFSKAGVNPPVFVAGSFTDPKWQPQELEYSVESTDSKGSASLQMQYRFSKSFNISPGFWEYKFRLGFGDWWLCDDNAETAVDRLGNWNNVLNVAEPVQWRPTTEYEGENPSSLLKRSDSLTTTSKPKMASSIRISAIEIDPYEQPVPATEAARRPSEHWGHEVNDAYSAGDRKHSFRLPARHSPSFSFECMAPQTPSDGCFGQQTGSAELKCAFQSLPLEASGDSPSAARTDEGQPLLVGNTQDRIAKFSGNESPSIGSSNDSQDEGSWLLNSLRSFVAWISSIFSRLHGSSR